jgi:hypothetical protein
MEVAADASEFHRRSRNSWRRAAKHDHYSFPRTRRKHCDREDRARPGDAVMPARHVRITTTLHVNHHTADGEREALLILLDFLLGSSIDEIAAMRRVDSRCTIEDALRLVLLTHGFTAAHGVDS